MKELIFDIVKNGLPLSVAASIFAQGLSIVPSQLVASDRGPVTREEKPVTHTWRKTNAIN